jgi:hypothetical protein
MIASIRFMRVAFSLARTPRTASAGRFDSSFLQRTGDLFQARFKQLKAA